MKIYKLTLGLLAGAMLAACSDDLTKEPAGGSDPNAIGSQGYIGISIGLPSEPVTRGENDDFDDGLESEYTVNSAGLIFFTGSDDNPTFYKAYDISLGAWNKVNDNPPQITQNQIVTFPVDFAKEATGDLWALAVINYRQVMTINDDRTVTINSNVFNGDFKAFMALTTDKSFRHATEGFFMTNAPYSSVPGTTPGANPTPGNPDFQVLSKVNKDRIYETQQAATQNPAAAIFVERAVAKVEVRKSDTFGVAQGAINFPEDFELSNLTVTWVIDNVEPSSYIVRNLVTGGGNNPKPEWALYDTNSTMQGWTGKHYRFLGAAGFGHTQWPNTPDPEEHYRTYFCADPNGSGITEGNNLNAITAGFTNTGSVYPQYCKENTFDVEHMDYRNTTRAVIKVQFGDGKANLYTVGEDKKNVYRFMDAVSFIAWDVLYDEDVIKAWKDHFAEEHPGEEYADAANSYNLTYNSTTRTVSNEWMELGILFNESIGRVQLNSIKLKDGKNNSKEISFDAKETIKRINDKGSVKYFKEGVAYYDVLIKHFGDELAPWTTVQQTTNTTTDSYGKTNGVIGPQDIQNYLGRYGVVRNNWYVVTLGHILQMGEPVQGDLRLDHTPDDRVIKEESISCRINILSWAKRNQTDNL